MSRVSYDEAFEYLEQLEEEAEYGDDEIIEFIRDCLFRLEGLEK